MVVCRYFLQGNCRFGNSCYNEHEVSSNPSQHTSIFRQSTFATQQTTQPQQQQAKPATNVDLATLTKAVIADMVGAEKGGQWILSSYAPFKEKPAFPGFEDHSFEEIRWGFYESSKNGTLEQYKQQLQAKYQEALQKVRALQNPSQEVITMLQNIYNSAISQETTNIFRTSNTSSNIFGGSSSGSNIFGASSPTTPTPSANIFATNNQQTAFGSSGNTNIFASATQNTSSSIFSGGGQNVFASANQATSPSIFSSQQQTPNSSIFVGDHKNAAFVATQSNAAYAGTQQNNIFATANASLFNTPQQQNTVFANNQVAANTQSSNIFQQQPSQGSMFGSQQPPAALTPNVPLGNVVAAPQPATNIFAAQPKAASNDSGFGTQNPPFGNQQNIVQTQTQPQPVQAAKQPASIFVPTPSEGNLTNAHNQSSSKTVIFGGVKPNNVIDESVYSADNELTDKEKQWFFTDDLDIPNIPDNPPTLAIMSWFASIR